MKVYFPTTDTEDKQTSETIWTEVQHLTHRGECERFCTATHLNNAAEKTTSPSI